MHKLLKEFKTFIITVFFINVFVIILSVLFNFLDFNLIMGSIFGTIYVILSFLLLINILSKGLRKSPEKAKSFIFTNYLIRHIINAIFIFICINSDHINPFSSIILLFAPRISFYVGLINNKK